MHARANVYIFILVYKYRYVKFYWCVWGLWGGEPGDSDGKSLNNDIHYIGILPTQWMCYVTLSCSTVCAHLLHQAFKYRRIVTHAAGIQTQNLLITDQIYMYRGVQELMLIIILMVERNLCMPFDSKYVHMTWGQTRTTKRSLYSSRVYRGCKLSSY